MKRKHFNRQDAEADDHDQFHGSDSEPEVPEKHEDGFANTILNLLKQETGTKLPVLSGRKTTLMKQLLEEQQIQKDLEKKRQEKKRKVDYLFQSEANVELERQLRKLATKGVVALFNAVAKAKKEMMDAKAVSQPDKSLKDQEEGKRRMKAERSSSMSNDQLPSKKWKVVNENATEELLLDWDKEDVN